MTGQRPWLLSAPALILFAVLLIAPLIMTFLLSFNSFDFYDGIGSDMSLANYREVLGDSYFYEIFGRTFAIALATTVICAIIGVPQAYFLNRMTPFWRSIMVLVTLGPLLISVVVRTLGWAILLGNKGVINTFLTDLGLIERPIRMMYTSGGIVLALGHVRIPFRVLAVWAAHHRQDGDGNGGGIVGGGAVHGLSPGCLSAGHPRCAFGVAHRLFAVCKRLCDAGNSGRTTRQGGGHSRL